jgi:Transforming acidic coiled-coil-containing protein (TACC), C-terminal
LPQVLHTMRGELDALKREVRLRQGSEEQMKQVLAEYEKTISELIAEKEKEQQKFNDEKVRLVAERDQVRQVQGR